MPCVSNDMQGHEGSSASKDPVQDMFPWTLPVVGCVRLCDLASATANDLVCCLPARAQGNINFSTQYNTERSTEDWTTPVVVCDRVYLTPATATDLGGCLPARAQGNINFCRGRYSENGMTENVCHHNFEIWPQHKPSARVGHSGLSYRQSPTRTRSRRPYIVHI